MIEYDFQIIEKFWDTFWQYCQEHNIKREDISENIIKAIESGLLKASSITF